MRRWLLAGLAVVVFVAALAAAQAIPVTRFDCIHRGLPGCSWDGWRAPVALGGLALSLLVLLAGWRRPSQ